MRDVVVVGGARTPIGDFGGAFKDTPAPKLAAMAIKASLERAGIAPALVDEVIFGNVSQIADYGYVARVGAIHAGIPETVPAIAVNRQCASGVESINLAVALIQTGQAEVIVAGGAENMSQIPFLVRDIRWKGLRLGNGALEDGAFAGRFCPVNHYHMGMTAENMAARFGISRQEQDELALLSHQRAVRAIQNGRFKGQMVNISVPQPKGDPLSVERDERPRADTSLEKLAKLKPVFKEGGTVTAGNASGMNDAAAAVVVMPEEKAKEMGLSPRFRWLGRSVVGVDPAFMGTGPVPAVRKIVQDTGIRLQDFDLIELNEAFAAQALYCIRELELDMDKTNVNGSGISLGHPVGATGAIITVKLMEELVLRDKELGLVTMCVGGGQGCATIFKRVG